MFRISWAWVAAFIGGLFHASMVHAEGGPDAFGYTWQTSAEPGAQPAYWVDISTIGTPVSGLADDNSVPIQIQFPSVSLDFTYYWRDYFGDFRIGSNGWVGFEGGDNLAGCFPGIPSDGGVADAYMAPFMADLTFSGVGNPAQVRTHRDVPGNRFIISFLDVPFWSPNSPGYVGSNTFQIVLNSDVVIPTNVVDNIDFNYLSLSPFTPSTACNEIVVGMESRNGAVGLAVLTDAVPQAPLTIRFSFPDTPLVQVKDAAPIDVLNPGSRAEIRNTVEAGAISGAVVNLGGAGINSTINTTANVRVPDHGGTIVYSATVGVPFLAGGETTALEFATPYTAVAGRQAVRFTASSAQDINPGNDTQWTLLIGLDGGPRQILSYKGAATDGAGVNLKGGSALDQYGIAVEYDPPDAGFLVHAVGLVMAANSDAYALELRDNNGIDGLPGSVLARVEVPAGTTTNGSWKDIELAAPVVVDADGFYLVWYQQSANNFLLSEATSLPSRRVLERVAGTFARYRDQLTNEPSLRVTVSPPDIFKNDFE